MTAPVWVIVFDRHDGRQLFVIQCPSPYEADKVIYHNTYYKCPCLKITVKAWR